MLWNPGWAWAGLIILVTVYVGIFDIHALITHTETMSGRMRDWIFNPYTAPFVMGGWIGLFGGIMTHWFVKRRALWPIVSNGSISSYRLTLR